jgi:hypothetical protein
VQLLGNFLRDLAWNRERLLQVSFISVRPDSHVGAGVHQLRVDMHFPARMPRGSFEHVRNAQRASNLTYIPFTAISHHAGSADHFEIGDLRQLG